MKLHLGCGSKRLEGFVNVDKYETSATDVVFDLETRPWPWPSSSVEEARFIHSLEHMGRDTDAFLGILQELYRVCRDRAIVVIHVPHPRHDDFLGDPTHVRPITPQLLSLFDRERNDQWVAGGISAATPLAHYIGVDFFLKEVMHILDPYWHAKYSSGELSPQQLDRHARDLNNVIAEIHITLVARKP